MITDTFSSAWFLTRTRNFHWDNELLGEFKRLRSSDSEAVDESALIVQPVAGQVRRP